MKKIILSILFAIVAVTAFSQSGAPAYSGVKYRVNDSTTYQAAIVTSHAQGYADIYWNNQATTPHWDIWNGASYDHIFDFNAGGSGGTIDGSGTTNELPYWVDSNTLGSLTTGTYPSLTELARVKGLTSAVQTQLDAKQATLVSNTNIKTVQSTTILGSGDIDLIDDAIVNGEAKAPSQNAVFDALALKANAATITTRNRLEPSEETASFTLSLADTSQLIILNNVADLVITLDDFSAFDHGTQWAFYRKAGTDTVYFDDGGETLESLTLGVTEGSYAYLYYNPDDNEFYLAAGGGSSGGGGGSGDVTKVGTPANNQVGVWTGDGTIEGASSLTYDGSNFQLTGDIGSTGTRITKGWFTDLQVTNAIAGSITGNAATVTTNANLTGHITSTGNAAVLGSFTSAQLGTAVTDEVGTGSLVLSEPDANVQTGSYTLVLTDKAKEVRMNVAGSNNLTVPLNATVAFPVGTMINIVQYGAGTTTVVATGGVTINSSAGNLLSPGQYSPMLLKKIATDEWFLWNGASVVTAAFTRTNGTYITTTLSGSPSGALNTAVDIQSDLTGVVPVSLGGTGTSSTTQTYTPTLTNTTNVAASTARLCQYMRVGNTITVSGQFDIDPTATGQIVMGISLPVASAFSTAFQAGGTAAPTTVADAPAAIISDATNDRATLTYICVDTTNHTMAFTFTYQVL